MKCFLRKWKKKFEFLSEWILNYLSSKWGCFGTNEERSTENLADKKIKKSIDDGEVVWISKKHWEER